MKRLKFLKEDIEMTSDFRGLIEVYEEMAAEEMKQIRDKILHGREFIEGLARLSVQIGEDVRKSFKLKKDKVAVFLSAGEGLYGDLVEKVCFRFLKYVEENRVKPVVVGKLGKAQVEMHKPGLAFQFFETDEELEKESLGYSEIMVFYGKYENIVKQTVMEDRVLGVVAKELMDVVKDKGRVVTKYIYEPSVDKVASKFGEEIKVSVLDGMVQENHLAKQAARLIQLDETIDNVDEKLDKLRHFELRARKSLASKKQRNRIVRFI